MQIIKLDATQSTNTYLKDLSFNKVLEDFTVISTSNQTSGRGQMSAKWESEPYKNLAFSVLKNDINVPLQRVFLISVCVSLAIIDALNRLAIPDLSIKWPNDILSGNSKIGGILIENILSGSKIKRTIIGFGLNVNQEVFRNAPNASSMKNIVGTDFNLDSVFYSIIEQLHLYLNKPIDSLEEELYAQYHTKLFRIGKVSTFVKEDDSRFTGTIEEVSIGGKLVVKHENGNLLEYGLKEIRLLY